MKDKSRRRIADRAEDIRLAIANIRSDVGDMSKPAFLVDGKTQRAVIEGLIVVGEAATHIIHAAPELENRQHNTWRHLQDAVGCATSWPMSIFGSMPRLFGTRSTTIFPAWRMRCGRSKMSMPEPAIAYRDPLNGPARLK